MTALTTGVGETNCVTEYLREVGRHPLLTREDEARLGREIHEGAEAEQRLSDDSTLSPAQVSELRRRVRRGRAAKRTFIESNLRLVVSVAGKYRSSGSPLEDLIQEGNLGLMHAVDKFDYRMGFKFSTYAVWWIRQSIQRGIVVSEATIRLPLHIRTEVVRLEKMKRDLEWQLGRPPSTHELSDAAGMEKNRVEHLLALPTRTVSLQRPVGEHGEEFVNFIADSRAASLDDTATVATLSADVDALVSSCLNAREREILRLHYGFDGPPVAFAEIARRFGLSRERIRQIEVVALQKLRDAGAQMHAFEDADDDEFASPATA